jgi:hypothetical protein
MFPNLERDEKAVLDLANDLQEFLRYTFFKQEDDCPDEIDRILDLLKARQEGKCVCRFDEIKIIHLEILDEAITFIDVGDVLEEDMLNVFIEMVGKHQDKMYDEWKQMSSSSQYMYSQLHSA